jgi:hypothetical protein
MNLLNIFFIVLAKKKILGKLIHFIPSPDSLLMGPFTIPELKKKKERGKR